MNIYRFARKISEEATTIISKVKYINYNAGLTKCDLTKLKTNILREDQADILKILDGYEANTLYILSRLRRFSVKHISSSVSEKTA